MECFCPYDAFQNRIRNDSSEQVCVCVCVSVCVCLCVCVCVRVCVKSAIACGTILFTNYTHGLAVIHQRRRCLSMVISIWDARSTYLTICRSVSTVDPAVTLRCFESILRIFDRIHKTPQGVLEHPPIPFFKPFISPACLGAWPHMVAPSAPFEETYRVGAGHLPYRLRAIP